MINRRKFLACVTVPVALAAQAAEPSPVYLSAAARPGDAGFHEHVFKYVWHFSLDGVPIDTLREPVVAADTQAGYVDVYPEQQPWSGRIERRYGKVTIIKGGRHHD